MERTTLFADVLLPLPLPGYFTYRVPFELNNFIKPGQRVSVQFGKKKIYAALVRRIHTKVPDFSNVKYILALIDELPVVGEKQFRFWEWMALYYMCTPGDVMNAALPSALKLQSETKISIHPGFNGDISEFNEKEYHVLIALQEKKSLSISQIAAITGEASALNTVKNLFEKGAVLPEEELIDKYKPKTEIFVKLTEDFISNPEQKNIIDAIEKKAPNQLKILLYLFDKLHRSEEKETCVSRSDLIKKLAVSSTQLNALVKKGICEIITQQFSRIENYSGKLKKLPDLNKYQEQALTEIKKDFSEKDVVLLHGITSSGKTEIYIRLIHDTISSGKEVLYLLPEIALTTQIINRLRKVFGNEVGVYHSRFNEAERVEIWNRVVQSTNDFPNSNETLKIILGARSSVFMPFNNLGLIIVDEEHDSSYKQYDPAPRYNARDSAIMLAKEHQAKVLLGSATPSVESYYNAENGKYSLVKLNKRHGEVQLPEILVSDIKEERKFGRMKSHFSPMLLDHIATALEHKEQVILFQNRRGFSLHLECDTCHWVPGCKNCDVTLTYHKSADQLRCHYCGFSTHVPGECPACKGKQIIMKGFGTEKIEDELPLFFPNAVIKRMDLDTTRSKNAYQQIINDFEDRKIDILVGTQMVTKGLDFDNVNFVGVMNADNMMNFPDFRAHERSYQLMSQVSGRAGRNKKRGKVILQTYNPDHFIIKCVIEQNYADMYHSQLLDRINFKYPPVYRIIELTLKHTKQNILNDASKELAKMLKNRFGNRVLGPEHPMVSKIKNEYLKRIIIKFEKDAPLKTCKEHISNAIASLRSERNYSQIKIQADVDPY